MARNPKRMALYEVIAKSRQKNRPVSRSGPAESEGFAKNRAIQPDVVEGSGQGDQSASTWPPRPVVSSVAGRLLFSISYPVACVLLLALILIAAVAFRFGQIYSERQRRLPAPEAVSSTNAGAGTEVTSAGNRQITDDRSETGPEKADETSDTDKGGVLKPVGDHVIVIATISASRDSGALVPVKEYFERNGIASEIQKRGTYYFLVTKDRYRSPQRAGSEGFYALKRIKETGANYKAPTGYETFGSKPFQDAYAMKIR